MYIKKEKLVGPLLWINVSWSILSHSSGKDPSDRRRCLPGLCFNLPNLCFHEEGEEEARSWLSSVSTCVPFSVWHLIRNLNPSSSILTSSLVCYNKKAKLGSGFLHF